MNKIDLSVRINGRHLTETEWEFTKLWIKFLELTLEAGSINIFINDLRIAVESLKRYVGLMRGEVL